MLSIDFWWNCIKEAWRGSWDRANGYATLLGAIVLWLGAAALGYQVIIPDTMPEAITLVVLCVGSAWVVIFTVRLIGAPARRYARIEAEKADIEFQARQLEQKRAILTVSGPHMLKDSRYKSQIRWRMTSRNTGRAAATNVQMKLRGGNSEPQYATWGADYPYPVIRVGSIIDAPEHQINPNDDESYEIICGWKSEAGPFFTTLDTKGGGHNPIQIETDERWELLYEATAGNAITVRFTLQIFLDGEGLTVIRTN